MAYKQLPIVQEEFATTKYANQIKDNFDAIVGGQILRESLTQLSNRLTSVSEQFGQYNEEIQLLITEFNLLRADIDKAIDAIDLRFNDLSEEITKRITTLGDNLKELESSTGYNTNLHQYFKNVEQARNLVLAINKLHEDLGDPRNLTTNLKENAITAINELDLEIGNVESIIDEEITASNLSEIINNLKELIGTFASINEEIKQDNFVDSINDIYDKFKKSILIKGKNIEIDIENKINVLGGVTKDYLPETKYYKNDFIWNKILDKEEEEEKKDVLYKVIQDFTSTTFEQDLGVNFIEVKTGGDGNVNQSAVVNTYKEETIFEEGDLILVTEDLDDPQNPINIDVVNKAVPVGCTYIHFANENGEFLEEESPATLYPNTEWQLMFNTESVYFRTEGSLSEGGRSSGVQGDAGRNIVGAFSTAATLWWANGAFYLNNSTSTNNSHTNYPANCNLNIDASRLYTTASEFRTKNRLIRIYKRIS